MKPRHSFLITHSAFRIAVTPFAAIVAAALAGPLSAQESASGTAAAIAIDSCGGALRAIAPRAIGYDPAWSGVTDAGAHVVVEKVEHADMFNASTSIVTSCAADATGAYPFAPAAGDNPCVRLIHRVYGANGAEVGKALVRDVSFGAASLPGTGTLADSRAESFQEAVSARKPVGLTFSTYWATNAASVAISAVKTKDGGGHDFARPVTNLFFSAPAVADGTLPWKPHSGEWRLLLTSFDALGNVLGEPCFADYFLRATGTVMMAQ